MRMHQGNIIEFGEDTQPMLMVVVDTEEEFDWNAPPDRSQVGVKHMEQLHLTHDICVDFGLSPCYVIDYAIANQKPSIDVLSNYHQLNQCEIGAHLHPWVNPPFEETLSTANMYPGNLDANLELYKLKNLQAKIAENFGFTPHIYKAGRYGFGPNTLKTLEKLGFSIDLSYCPPINHTKDGGPNYSYIDSLPFVFNDSKVLEIPISGGFTGKLGNLSRSMFDLAKELENFRVPGILARTQLLDRLILSPEGYTSDEHIKLTKHLFNKGHRLFTWSFHSPTVIPGNTDYVTSKQEQQVYLDSFKRFFDFFFNQLNGRAVTPTEIYAMTEK
ncbi:polysaccharide deacetylase family protein [Glaciecola petra]|uniref:Polysaccharide deacetylase family protein n=1 Tax=Glaciecola petra TaxID=3075602 RepID=A0ABU2ZMH8_9ALTE|nr:polysaccharide deacetylase family protein [Aestuariibacter sp. P117]MDT0593616.1 polysaccharide deacetylase family protein [Aestuariibacter sp. P117]